LKVQSSSKLTLIVLLTRNMPQSDCTYCSTLEPCRECTNCPEGKAFAHMCAISYVVAAKEGAGSEGKEVCRTCSNGLGLTFRTCVGCGQPGGATNDSENFKACKAVRCGVMMHAKCVPVSGNCPTHNQDKESEQSTAATNQSSLCSWEWACCVAKHELVAKLCCKCEKETVHHLCALAATRATGISDSGTDFELCYNCYKELNTEFPLDMTYHPYKVVFAVGENDELTVRQAFHTRKLGNCSVELCVIAESGPQVQMDWGNRSLPAGEFEQLCLESFRSTMGGIVDDLSPDDAIAEFFPDNDPQARAVELVQNGVWVGMPAYAAMSKRLDRCYMFFKHSLGDACAPRLVRCIKDSELGNKESRTVEILFSATDSGASSGPMTNAHHTYLQSTTLEREMARFPGLELDKEFAAAKMHLVNVCVCECDLSPSLDSCRVLRCMVCVFLCGCVHADSCTTPCASQENPHDSEHEKKDSENTTTVKVSPI
jgi:hypothetical protein